MKSIGQFAKENNVTIKALHHYEKMELLFPIKVDEETGYRYYEDAQSTDLKVILYLKELGFSLSEIKQILTEEIKPDDLQPFLEYKKNQSKKDKETAAKRFHKINTLLKLMDSKQTNINVKELIMMNENQMNTGKYGRDDFIKESETMFEQAMKNNTPLSVVQIDLDHFYNINQDFGYEVGDIVLERTRNEIENWVMKSTCPTIFERRGGDEFSITIADTLFNTSINISNLLNNITSIDYSDVADGLKVRATAGMVSRTKKSETYSELVQDATLELFKNKKARK